MLATWNKREGELIAQHPGAVPAVAFPPEPVGAYVGQDLPSGVMEKIAKEGARTIPGREHGGNCDASIFEVTLFNLSFDIPLPGNRSRTCPEGQDVTFLFLSKARIFRLETCIFLREM